MYRFTIENFDSRQKCKVGSELIKGNQTPIHGKYWDAEACTQNAIICDNQGDICEPSSSSLLPLSPNLIQHTHVTTPCGYVYL